MTLRVADSSVIVSGGDVSIDGSLYSSLVIASGDVKLNATVGHAFVIAGGTVTVQRNVGGSILVSAGKIGLKQPNRLKGPVLVFDAKAKPAPGLFRTHDMWAEDGLQATIKHGGVTITKVAPAMADFFKEGDIVVACKGKKVESLAQFRRLIVHSRDTARLDFEVERAGRRVVLGADLNKDNYEP